MIPQPTQHESTATRTAVTVVGTHTVDMSEWELAAVLADKDGTEIVTKTTQGGDIAIDVMTATIDLTAESVVLAAGVYDLSIRRTGTGVEDLLAVVHLAIIERDPWTI